MGEFEHAEVSVSSDSVIIRYPRAEIRESLTRRGRPVHADWETTPEVHFRVHLDTDEEPTDG